MPWFVSMLIISLLFFAASYAVSEKLIGRINRSKFHRRGLDLTDQRKQQLNDEIAHWVRKQE